MNKQNDPPTSIELRIRTMRVIWISMLLSIGAYYVFTLLKGRPADLPPNQTISLALIGGAALAALVSFPSKASCSLKQSNNNRSGWSSKRMS